MSKDWRGILPGWQPGAPLLECRELGHGISAEVWRVSTALGRYVLKRRRRKDAVVDLTRMQALQTLAAEHGFAPRLLAIDLTEQLDVAEWLPGRNPTAEEFSRPEFLQRVAQGLGRLHRLPLPAAWSAQSNWQFDLQDQLQARWYRLCQRGEFAGRGALAARIARVPAQLERLQVSRRPQALLHLDAHAGNVLATDELCLLDWEYAHLGDPLWDLASLTAPLPLDRALGVVLLRAAGREADSTWEQLRNASELCRLLHELWQLEQ